jgi:hypothetical protein
MADPPADRPADGSRYCFTAGLREVAFDGAPALYGVGVNRLDARAASARRAPPARLFTFG